MSILVFLSIPLNFKQLFLRTLGIFKLTGIKQGENNLTQ